MVKRTIVDVSKPELLSDIFPHSTPPVITFDNPLTEKLGSKTYTIHTEEIKKRDIVITDTTFRDGQQAREPYTVEQIVTLYDFLSKLSGSKGVIRQTEFFIYSNKDREAVEKCQEKGHKYPEITM